MSSCAAARWNMFIGNVQTAAKQAFAKVIVKAAALGLLDEDDTGGCFGLLMLGAMDFLIPPMQVGKVPDDKDGKYVTLCQEKARRLEDQFKQNRHVTSWQSRDPEKGLWGGAVLGPDGQERQYAFSFSGLPELCDEALSLLVAVMVGHLTSEAALEIGRVSGSDEILARCLEQDEDHPEEPEVQ